MENRNVISKVGTKAKFAIGTAAMVASFIAGSQYQERETIRVADELKQSNSRVSLLEATLGDCSVSTPFGEYGIELVDSGVRYAKWTIAGDVETNRDAYLEAKRFVEQR